MIKGLDGGVSYDFAAIGMRWNWGENGGPVWGQWSERITATPVSKDMAAPPETPAPGAEPQQVGQVTSLTISTTGQNADAVRAVWTPAENAQVHFVVYIRSDFADAGNYGRAQMASFNGSEGVIKGLDRSAGYDFIAIGMRWNWGQYGTVWGQWSEWTRTPARAASRPAGLSGDAARDWAALVALYQATDGDNWHYSANWLSAAPLREWYGVDTDASGRVIRLEFRENYLTGVIPTEVSSLTSLETLHLGNNGLTGAIPAELGNLTSLESLHLYGNELTGEIPAELGNLAGLESLHLGGNELTGAIPAELGRLAKLETLSLYRNDLTGAVPADLGSLANLQSLNLEGNVLTGEIPTELGGLANLQRLRLGDNVLTGVIPVELGSLVNLRTLDLKGNVLTGMIPPELGRLVNLSTLDLSGNVLTGAIPTELGNLANLKGLLLHGNALTGTIPTELGGLDNLENLHLAGNSFTGCLPWVWRARADYYHTDLLALGLPWCEALPEDGEVYARERAALAALYAATDGPNWRSNYNWLSDAPVSKWFAVDVAINGRVKGLLLANNGLTGEIPAELGSLTSL